MQSRWRNALKNRFPQKSQGKTESKCKTVFDKWDVLRPSLENSRQLVDEFCDFIQIRRNLEQSEEKRKLLMTLFRSVSDLQETLGREFGSLMSQMLLLEDFNESSEPQKKMRPPRPAPRPPPRPNLSVAVPSPALSRTHSPVPMNVFDESGGDSKTPRDRWKWAIRKVKQARQSGEPLSQPGMQWSPSETTERRWQPYTPKVLSPSPIAQPSQPAQMLPQPPILSVNADATEDSSDEIDMESNAKPEPLDKHQRARLASYSRLVDGFAIMEVQFKEPADPVPNSPSSTSSLSISTSSANPEPLMSAQERQRRLLSRVKPVARMYPESRIKYLTPVNELAMFALAKAPLALEHTNRDEQAEFFKLVFVDEKGDRFLTR
jgi:hypothetical protein